jgi:hypothetical protein
MMAPAWSSSVFPAGVPTGALVSDQHHCNTAHPTASTRCLRDLSKAPPLFRTQLRISREVTVRGRPTGCQSHVFKNLDGIEAERSNPDGARSCPIRG